MKENSRRPGAAGMALWGLLALSIAAIIVLVLVKKAPETSEATGQKPVSVRVLTVSPRELPDTVSLPGRIEAFVQAELAAEKAGRVESIAVEKGDSVEKGQLLMQVDDSIWRTGLKRAEVEQREAARDLGRWEALKESGAVSDSELDGARTRMDLAEAALEEYRTHVAKCRIESPMRGIVNDRFVDEGEYIGEGAAALQVVDIDTVKLMVNVPEKDILSVSEDDRIEFRVNSLADRVFTGRVAFVSLLADPQANVFEIEIRADNPGHDLRPGMIAEVSLARATYRDAIAVPLSAVIPRKGEHVVFLAEGGHAVLRVVRLHSIVGRDAVLTGGLSAGDRLIVEGHRVLEDGAVIDIAP